MFSDVQTELPLVQPLAVPTCPVIGSQGSESDTNIATSPPQEVVEGNKVSLALGIQPKVVYGETW